MKNPIKYPVNRPLDDMERANYLPQKTPAPIPVAWPQLSVIKMNSTFLECVDLRFARKGFGTTFCIAALSIFAYFSLSLVLLGIEQWPTLEGDTVVEMLLFNVFALLISGLCIAFSIYLLTFECFHYTHYPMRFNRKTRMVHVFLEWQKGKTFSVPWDEIYFTHTGSGGRDCTVQGHKLAEDGVTVLETFSLSNISGEDSEYRFLQWEFVRQYMEGDDKRVAELANMVNEVMDVAERRETPYASFRRAYASFAAQHLHLGIVFMPFILLATIGRIIAARTCKIPRWPAEIEAVCQIEPNDPNIRDGKHLAARGAAPYPDVSAYVGK